MLEVELGRDGEQAGRQHRVAAAQPRDELGVQEHVGTVVAVVVRVVVALLRAGVDAVGNGGVENGRHAIGVTSEAATPRENHGVTGGGLDQATAPARVPTGDVADLDAVAP